MDKAKIHYGNLTPEQLQKRVNNAAVRLFMAKAEAEARKNADIERPA